MSRLCSSQRKYTIVAAKKLHGKEIVPWPIDRSAKQWLPFSVVSPGLYTHVLRLTGNCGCVEIGDTHVWPAPLKGWLKYEPGRQFERVRKTKNRYCTGIYNLFFVCTNEELLSAVTDDESRSVLKTQVEFLRLQNTNSKCGYRSYEISTNMEIP